MKIRHKKVERTLKKQIIKRLLQDKKVPGTSAGTRVTAALGPAPIVSLGLPIHPYSPPCDFKQPGLSWCCSSLVWQERKLLTRLSPRSPIAVLMGAGPRAAVTLVPALVPGTFLS